MPSPKELLARPTVVLTPARGSAILLLNFWRHFSSPLEFTMVESQQEKRAVRRFALHVPVTVNRNGSGQIEAADIRDVSARGICFYLDSAVAQGAAIGFTLTLPPEITLTESIRVQCKGHVVRVEDNSEKGKVTVAAVIEEYEFLPEV
jgi:hypothetical protein